MEKSGIPTVKEIQVSKTIQSSGNRRRRPLRSRTVDTLLHILSLCYADSSHLIQNSDEGIQIDVPLDCIDSTPNDSLFQEQASMDETQVVLGTNSSVNFAIKSQDNYDLICSSPHLPTYKDVEEGEISGGFMAFMPEIDAKSVEETDSEPQDLIGAKTGLKNDGNTIPLFTDAVGNDGTDVRGVVNKTTRNLVDYSEIVVHAKPQESAKQASLKIKATKNQNVVKDNGARKNRKRQGSCTEEERRNKKSKKSVDPITGPENLALLGQQHLVVASQEVDASAKKVACNEKKKKKVVTKERRAKKKIREKIKQAEKNRKLGIKRLKLQPVVKEKKITYCRHYINGRCHEGEKCKFSHDTVPLTKSKPCRHFARHACMKGDDCPFDHQLAKYPCNNYQTKGSCNRGSDCMFSHEAQPSEATLNKSNKSNPEQIPTSNSSSKTVETKSCSVPKFVTITPKSTRPPKGINFLSQEKLPPETRPSPKLNSEVKEITKTPPLIQDSENKKKMLPLVQDSAEITKTPPVVPRGINFLSFGKKPGLDCSSGGYPFRISNEVEKPRLSEGLKSGSTVNLVNEVKVDFSIDRPSSSRKPIPVMSFMSSTSQKVLHSTLAFASELDSGVKSKV